MHKLLGELGCHDFSNVLRRTHTWGHFANTIGSRPEVVGKDISFVRSNHLKTTASFVQRAGDVFLTFLVCFCDVFGMAKHDVFGRFRAKLGPEIKRSEHAPNALFST